MEVGHKKRGKIASLCEFAPFVRVRTLMKTDLRTLKSFQIIHLLESDNEDDFNGFAMNKGFIQHNIQ